MPKAVVRGLAGGGTGASLAITPPPISCMLRKSGAVLAMPLV